jgi:uncharacterized protein (TIGR03083 family)
MADPQTTRNLVADWRAVLERTAVLVAELDDEALAQQSYASEWTIQKVLSHMGSGAEIFARIFDAAAGRGEAPGPSDFPEYWAEWDAKSPRETAIAWRESTAALVAQVEGYDDDTLATASLELFGRERGIAQLAGMRLSEDTLHGWDIAVALDDDAELDPAGVKWVVDHLDEMVGYVGKAVTPLRAAVHTVAPDLALHLEVGEHVTLRLLEEEDAGAEDVAQGARLDLPAAAFVRLVYGRMDPAHTPEGVQAEGVDLDTLRATFPGF